jgi:small GTP-binding protein
MNFGDATQLFRVVTLGESSVGKSSLINRLVNKEFNPGEQATIGATFLLHSEEIDGARIEMQIWDTAGQEKYKSLSPIYCRGAAAAVVAFDVTNHESFEKLEQWTNLVSEVSGTDTAIFIAANKCDLLSRIEVSEEQINRWAASRNFRVVRTSAKTGEGVAELFRAVAEAIFRGACITRTGDDRLRVGGTVGDGGGGGCC